MTEIKKIRWGIIGCGDVTEVKSGPAYQKVEGFELKAVMRRDLEKVKDYAKRHGIEKYYIDADTLIHDDEIDAVYIATPPDSHAHYALKVAAAGKPCCIEKPMAPSYAESKVIYEAFKEKQIPLFVAYYRRSMPRFEQVHTWLDAAEIGEVRHISWQLVRSPSEVDKSGIYNWRTELKVAPGGYFDDLGSHGLDLFTYFLGNIKEVYGIKQNQQNFYDAPDTVTACWIHQNGITGNAVWNFASDRVEDRVEIYGSKGKIEFAIFEDQPVVLYTEGMREVRHIKHSKNVQLEHVSNMAKHLLHEGYEHPSNGQSAMHTSWVMDKILGSLEQ